MTRPSPRSALCGLLLLGIGRSASAQQFPTSHSTSTFARDCVGRHSEPLFVLSFDDGPWEYTGQILDILGDKGAPATFFVIGSNIDAFPQYKEQYKALVRRMMNEGHVVANHGMTNEEFTLEDVNECHEIISDITNGHEMQFFRPARGAYTTEKLEELVNRDYRTVMWNIDIQDWRSEREPDGILDLVRTAVEEPTKPADWNDPANAGLPRRGSYILLSHDNSDKMLQTVSDGRQLLAAMIDTIRGAGYRIVSLNECLGVPPGSGGAPPPSVDSGSYCGLSWIDAHDCDKGECPSGTDAECTPGLECFGGVTCPLSNGKQNGDSGDDWDWSKLDNSSRGRRNWKIRISIVGVMLTSALSCLI